MDTTFGKIPPLYVEGYMTIGWIGFAIFCLWMQCRERGFVSWGGFLFGAVLLPPAFTIAAPIMLMAGGMLYVLIGVEKVFGSIGNLVAPILHALRPIGRVLTMFGRWLMRALNAKAFSCKTLKIN